MPDDLLQLALHLDSGPEADAEELEHSTTRMRQRLLELEVQDVRGVSGGEAPAGTRAVDVMQLGALVVTMARAPGALKSVTSLLQSWVSARTGRSIEVVIDGDSLKLSGVSQDQQSQLVAMFIQRHST